MNAPLNILLVAPVAPPYNAPEAIQIGRILAELDTKACGRLVTTAAANAHSWIRSDTTLALPLTHFDTDILKLPWHPWTSRIVMSHRLARFHVPDAFFWMCGMDGRVARNLTEKPQVIYSRSMPMSGALLAQKLKSRLGIPWVMHLSDPWADSPYNPPNPRDTMLEARCFHDADRIALTTTGQAAHYQKKYPALAHKIIVSPNVMPTTNDVAHWLENAPARTNDARLHLVFAGSLYGSRSPEPLLKAITILRATRPALLAKLHIDFYGNVQDTIRPLLGAMPDVISYRGCVAFREALHAQHAADAALTIEPDTHHLLDRCFLPSKVTDCLALGKPIVAITPDGSETAAICAQGYGWAAPPTSPERIAERLAILIESLPALRQAPTKPPPSAYAVTNVVDDLLMHMRAVSTT